MINGIAAAYFSRLSVSVRLDQAVSSHSGQRLEDHLVLPHYIL